MYHSMYFQDDEGNTYNTWDNWYLVPSERPSIAPPSVNAPYDDFKDEFGGINLRLLDTNDVEYESRSGSHTWIIDNEYGEHGNWYDIYSDVMLKLHGKKLKVWLEDEPDFYYYGRLIVTNFKSEESYSTIEIQYLFEPYKYKMTPRTYSSVLKLPIISSDTTLYFLADGSADYVVNYPSDGFDYTEESGDGSQWYKFTPKSSFETNYTDSSALTILNGGKFDAPIIVKVYPYIKDVDDIYGDPLLFYIGQDREEHSLRVNNDIGLYFRRLRITNMSFDKLTGNYKSLFLEDFNPSIYYSSTANKILVFDGVNKSVYSESGSIFGPRKSSVKRTIDWQPGVPGTNYFEVNAKESFKSYNFPIAKPGTTNIHLGISDGCYCAVFHAEEVPSYARRESNRYVINNGNLYAKIKYDVEVHERYI